MNNTLLKQTSAGAKAQVFGLRPGPGAIEAVVHIVLLDDREATAFVTDIEDDFELLLSDGESFYSMVAELRWTDKNDENGRREYELRLKTTPELPTLLWSGLP